MKVRKGDGTTKYGPGVCIDLTGGEVATAIDAWLVAQGVCVRGPWTITVNDRCCVAGRVYVDPSGSVVANGQRFSGRGDAMDAERERRMRSWTYFCLRCGTPYDGEGATKGG